MELCLFYFMSAEDSNSCLHACTTTTLPHWAMSPASFNTDYVFIRIIYIQPPFTGIAFEILSSIQLILKHPWRKKIEDRKVDKKVTWRIGWTLLKGGKYVLKCLAFDKAWQFLEQKFKSLWLSNLCLQLYKLHTYGLHIYSFINVQECYHPG